MRPIRVGTRNRFSKSLGKIRSGMRGSLALATKEMIYLLSCPGKWMCFLLSFGFSGILIFQAKMSQSVLLLGVVVIVLSGYRFVFGSIDGEVIGRYSLLPLRGSDLLGAKNLAYFVIMAVLILPPNAVSMARGENHWPLLLVPAAMSVMLLSCLVGGCYSVLFPHRENSANTTKWEGSTGGFILALVLWLVPYAGYRLVENTSMLFQMISQGFLLCVCLAAYRLLMPRIGAFMERQRGSIMKKIQVS